MDHSKNFLKENYQSIKDLELPSKTISLHIVLNPFYNLIWPNHILWPYMTQLRRMYVLYKLRCVHNTGTCYHGMAGSSGTWSLAMSTLGEAFGSMSLNSLSTNFYWFHNTHFQCFNFTVPTRTVIVSSVRLHQETTKAPSILCMD